MTDIEKDIRHREKQLADCTKELELMERDYISVRSERSKVSIKENIHHLKRRIENLEFKLWKLNK